MVSLVYLTTRSHSKLASDLEMAGFRVHEALEVSEVLHEDIDAILIGADVTDSDLIEVQLRNITIKLKPETTVRDVIAELWQLFPDKQVRIQ
jgi:hypothetical protein